MRQAFAQEFINNFISDSTAARLGFAEAILCFRQIEEQAVEQLGLFERHMHVGVNHIGGDFADGIESGAVQSGVRLKAKARLIKGYCRHRAEFVFSKPAHPSVEAEQIRMIALFANRISQPYFQHRECSEKWQQEQ